MKKQLIIKLATLALAVGAQARDLPVPHGADTLTQAAACGVGPQHGEFGGPLGQTGKAGQYNSYCKDLTDAEICLAIVKSSITKEGKQYAPYNQAKAKYCVGEFLNNLIKD